MRMSVRVYVYVHIDIVVYVVAVLYSGCCVLALPCVRTYADVCVSVRGWPRRGCDQDMDSPD